MVTDRFQRFRRRVGPRPILQALVSLWLWLVTGALALAAPGFRTELEEDSVAAGETATLKLIFTDLGNVQPPALPELPNCTSRFAGSGSQFSIVNFERSSSIIHQYALQPKAPGVIEIPALTVDVNGQRYTSNPLKLRVGQGFDSGQLGFLRLVVPKTEFNVGETVPVEIRFYFKHAPARQNPPKLKLDGFIKGKENTDNLPPETINGEVYSVMRNTLALTAVKAGELTLGPAEFETLYVLRSNRRRRILNDPLFGGGGEQKQINFASEPVKIRVVPPPSVNQPSGFGGAVGRFSLDPVLASPTNVAVGDPITVRLTVRGRGSFGSLKLPEPPAGSGFQAYPGTNSFEEADALGLEGVKTFETVLVPEQAGVQRLRLPPFIAWNPETKRYDTLEPRPISVNVRPGVAAQAQPAGNVPAASTPEPTAPRSGPVTEAVPLKTELGPLAGFSPALVQRPWFLAVLLAAPLLWTGLRICDRLRERARQRGPDLRGQRERLVNESVAQLAVEARAGRSTEFFAALNRALQEQLALTLGGSAGAFTEDVVAARLEPRGLSVAEAERLRALFEAVAQVRYSPVTSRSALDALTESARQAIAALKNLEDGR
jgi:hypothetical protein